jgi:hypothetical protein
VPDGVDDTDRERDRDGEGDTRGETDRDTVGDIDLENVGHSGV